MRKWKAKQRGSGALPDEIGRALRRRIRHVLERLGVSDEVIANIVSALFDQVSWAYVEREYELVAEGPGRSVSGPANFLSVNVADLLEEYGVLGNWLRPGDDEEHGAIGPVAELEAIAQTAFREACGEEVGVMARPARITEARKRLGKVHRTKLPDLFVWGLESGGYSIASPTNEMP
jgi:hypothetical protein